MIKSAVVRGEILQIPPFMQEKQGVISLIERGKYLIVYDEDIEEEINNFIKENSLTKVATPDSGWIKDLAAVGAYYVAEQITDSNMPEALLAAYTVGRLVEIDKKIQQEYEGAVQRDYYSASVKLSGIERLLQKNKNLREGIFKFLNSIQVLSNESDLEAMFSLLQNPQESEDIFADTMDFISFIEDDLISFLNEKNWAYKGEAVSVFYGSLSDEDKSELEEQFNIKNSEGPKFIRFVSTQDGLVITKFLFESSYTTSGTRPDPEQILSLNPPSYVSVSLILYDEEGEKFCVISLPANVVEYF